MTITWKLSLTQLTKTRSSFLQSLIVVITLLWSACAAAQQLNATVDRTSIGEDETLTLAVRYSGASNVAGQPDFSELSNDFEILNQSQSNQIRNFNGRVESFTEWTLVIAPRRTGSLLVPPFKFQGQNSDAVRIEVHEAKALPPGMVQEVFIETSLDKSSAYVQEQVILKYRFYYSVNIDELAKDEPEFNNVIVEPLEESRYSKTLNGRPFQVVEFSYALFPQSSGLLEIPQLTWNARISRSPRRSIFDFNGGRYELKRLKTDYKAINVKEKPATYPVGAPWLPTSALTLEESWANDPTQFKVGEPITRTLNLQANGLMAAQLPEIHSEPKDTRVKFYPDQPKQNDKLTPNGVIAQRLETAAVVVGEGGEITIPAVKVPWWNVDTDKLEYAEIPERRFLVAASEFKQQNQAARQKAIEETQIQNTEQNHQSAQVVEVQTTPFSMYLLLLLLALACAVFAFLWLQTLKALRQLQAHDTQSGATTTSKASSEKALFKELQNSCTNDPNPQKIRHNTLVWAKRFFGKNSTSLSDVYRCSNDETLKAQCLALDAKLFGSDLNTESTEAFNANRYCEALEKLRTSYTKKEQASRENLAPLY